MSIIDLLVMNAESLLFPYLTWNEIIALSRCSYEWRVNTKAVNDIVDKYYIQKLLSCDVYSINYKTVLALVDIPKHRLNPIIINGILDGVTQHKWIPITALHLVLTRYKNETKNMFDMEKRKHVIDYLFTYIKNDDGICWKKHDIIMVLSLIDDYEVINKLTDDVIQCMLDSLYLDLPSVSEHLVRLFARLPDDRITDTIAKFLIRMTRYTYTQSAIVDIAIETIERSSNLSPGISSRIYNSFITGD